MASRRKIGIYFNFDENWAGGMYYVFNVINSLNYLQEERPEIFIFYSNSDVKEKLKVLNYPFLRFLPIKKKPTVLERAYIKIRRIFSGKGFRYKSKYSKNVVDFLFPCNSHEFEKIESLKDIRKVYWIPDFQHKYLPHFFSEEEIEQRNRSFASISKLNAKLVLSSENAKKDFLKFYPDHNVTISVAPFATVLPAFAHVSMEYLESKYKISAPYFIAPNQFWIHKNHMVILRAALILKKKGVKIKVLFTGKEYDYRYPGYTEGLKEFIKENLLEDYFSFLGFIDRSEQLQLMKNAIAVIQPSLFEGWSTVVEDTKAMNQSLILSDLEVHREQCGQNAAYFDPHNEQQLALHLEKFMTEKESFPTYSYTDRILEFAKRVANL